MGYKMKICIGNCKKNLPETVEFFKIRTDNGKFRNECIECEKIKQKQNRDKIENKLKQQEYWKNNKKVLSEKRKFYVENNRKFILEGKKQYYKNNKEKCIESVKQYYKNNTVKKLEYWNNYYKENKGDILNYWKNYRIERGIGNGKTLPEKQIENFFIENDIKYETEKWFENCRSSKSSTLHFDFWLPELNTLIEYDGIQHIEPIFGKEKLIEQQKNDKIKNEYCKNNNIKLIRLSYIDNFFVENLELLLLCNSTNYKVSYDQNYGVLFPDEWKNKKEICKSIVLAKSGIFKKRLYARKCKIKQVENCISDKFLNENHLQGTAYGKENYGLYDNGELIQIISIGPSRFKENELELYRFATKLNTQVVGGFGKLIKHVNKPMVTFADCRYSNGKTYEKYGKFLYKTQPNYWYIKENYKLSRYQCMKHKLPKLLGENFDPNLTEKENMFKNGWRILYDCGNLKYIINTLGIS